jgi:hypothetical protein
MIVAASLFTLLLGICLFVGLPHVGARRRLASVATFVLLSGAVYAGAVDLLGSPKPLRLEWRGLDKATVLAASMQEGEAVYVWVKTASAPAPRAYVLPWDTRMAQQLQDAVQKREASGAPVQMTVSPESGGNKGTPKFYPEPQKPRAAKGPAGGRAAEFRHPGG